MNARVYVMIDQYGRIDGRWPEAQYAEMLGAGLRHWSIFKEPIDVWLLSDDGRLSLRDAWKTCALMGAIDASAAVRLGAQS